MPLAWEHQKALIDEASLLLKGGTLLGARWDDPNFVLVIAEKRQSERRFRLLFSLHPRFSRCHLTRTRFSSKKSRKTTTPRFVEELGSLDGDVVESLTITPGDRIVTLALRDRRSGKLTKILSELFGSRGNVYRLNETMEIQAALRSRKGFQEPGSPYQLPPPPSHKGGKTFAISPPDGDEETRDMKGNGSERWSGIADQFFEHLEKLEARTARHSLIKAAINKEAGRIQRLVDGLQRDSGSEELVPTLRLHADYLLAHLHQLSTRMDSFVIPDLEVDDPRKTVKLDPTLSPRENAESLYRRAKQLTRRAKGAKARLHAAEIVLVKWTQLSREVESINPTTAEETELERLEAALPSPTSATSSKSLRSPTVADGIRRFRSRDGLAIWIGRDDKTNDRLTFRLARGKDLWLHIHEAPGSHVVVRLEGRDGVPARTLEDASQLAMYYSRRRESSQGDVIYTPTKWVKRPGKGSPPGKVITSRFRTYHVRPDPALIETLLAGREI